jgi:hypothetical protein
MARTAADENAQNFLINWRVIRATILMKTKSDWLFELPLTADCMFIEVESLALFPLDEAGGGWSVAGVESKRGRLSSEVESVRPVVRNIPFPTPVITIFNFSARFLLRNLGLKFAPIFLITFLYNLKVKTYFPDSFTL